MQRDESVTRRPAAAGELNQHEGWDDGLPVVESLDGGLALLAHSLYIRLHEEVEQTLGADSMLVPISPAKTRAKTLVEINMYQAAESAVAVGQGGYLRGDAAWYVRWLVCLRLGELSADGHEIASAARYLTQSADQRRLTFSNVLSRVLPESRGAPLVLLRLFPLAVHAVTALAFGDQIRAEQLRAQQTQLLPALTDCRDCHGRLLANGELCTRCGNPLWKTQWLKVAD